MCAVEIPSTDVIWISVRLHSLISLWSIELSSKSIYVAIYIVSCILSVNCQQWFSCSFQDRQQKESSIKFHRFPKDSEIKCKWINNCRRSDLFSVRVVRVCSTHFDENNSLHDLNSKLLNLLMKLIKTDAIPHLNLPEYSTVLNHFMLHYNCIIWVDERNVRK